MNLQKHFYVVEISFCIPIWILYYITGLIYDEFKGEYEQAWEYIHLFFALCAQIYTTDFCFILSKKKSLSFK